MPARPSRRERQEHYWNAPPFVQALIDAEDQLEMYIGLSFPQVQPRGQLADPEQGYYYLENAAKDLREALGLAREHFGVK